jgi:hypothetical protein
MLVIFVFVTVTLAFNEPIPSWKKSFALYGLSLPTKLHPLITTVQPLAFTAVLLNLLIVTLSRVSVPQYD